MAVEEAHAQGAEILVCLRAAGWKAGPPWEEFFMSEFYESHPEWRCIDQTDLKQYFEAVRTGKYFGRERNEVSLLPPDECVWTRKASVRRGTKAAVNSIEV